MSPAPRIRIKMLGALQVLAADGRALALPTRKAQALLCRVALEADVPQARERLVAMLWEESPAAQARGSLRTALSALRRALPEGVLEIDARHVCVRAGAVEVDARQLREALACGTPAALAGVLERDLEGELLEGFDARAPAFDEWLRSERHALREQTLLGMRRLLAQRCASLDDAPGHPEQAIGLAVRLLALEPFDESTHRSLMRLYLRAGRRGAALQQFSRCAQLLERELGVAPEPATLELRAEILAGSKAAAQPAAVAAAPPPVRARTGAASLDAGLRHATVLCAGVSSGEGGAGLPEAVLDALCAELERFGATLTRRQREQLVAVFGVPRARSRDAELAVRAACALHEVLGHGAERVRVGLAAGQVMVSEASTGGPRVMGEVLGRASALQLAAAPGETLLEAALQRSLPAWVRCVPLERAGAWRVDGLDEARAAGAAELPLVGRALELRLLENMCELSLDAGCGHSVLVRGEAGIGKTRLVQQACASAAQLGFAVLHGSILDFGIGAPLDALRSVLAGALALLPDGGRALERECAPAGTLARVLLDDLLGRAPAPEHAALLEASGEAHRAATRGELACALLCGACAHFPLLVVFEDIHWADGALLDVCEAVMERVVAEHRLVLVMTSRVEGEPLTAQRSRRAALSMVELAGLREAEARALAHEVCTELPEAQLEACLERAGGNPLFLTLLVRAAGAGSERDLPAAVHSLVQARLDALAPPSQALCWAAAVLGQRPDPAALAALADERLDVSAALEPLLHAGLLRRERAGGVLTFVHALVQDAVYAAIPAAQRRALHARAAAWYGSDGPARDAVLRAEHLGRSGDPGAARACLDAARELAAALHPHRAVGLAARGLELAPGPATRSELVYLRAESLRVLGQTDDALRDYRALLADLGTEADPQLACRAWLGLATALRVHDALDEALDALEQAQRLADALGLLVERSRIDHQRGNILFQRGELEGCRAAHEHALELARRAGSVREEAMALGGLGDAHYLRGAMHSARERFVECVELARRHQLGRVQVSYAPMTITTDIYLCRLDAMLEATPEVLALAEAVGDRRAQLIALSGLCEALLLRDALERFDEVCERCLRLSHELGARAFEATTLVFRALALARRGQREHARTALRRARSLVELGIGRALCGAMVYGVDALLATDGGARHAALARALELVERGVCISHNVLYAWPLAMCIALHEQRGHEVEALAASLEHYARDEPLPWTRLFAAWGRALAACAEGRASARELDPLVRQLDAVGLRWALLPVERLRHALETDPHAERARLVAEAIGDAFGLA